ncbi:hypothetical protein CGU37_27645, partial [Pseudomonas fluorescens]
MELDDEKHLLFECSQFAHHRNSLRQELTPLGGRIGVWVPVRQILSDGDQQDRISAMARFMHFSRAITIMLVIEARMELDEVAHIHSNLNYYVYEVACATWRVFACT